ncbi:MAG: response regulator, partial [Spartobacteria bacterium]|nr:response regulator [Spartobacteria bacterium]
MKRKVLIIDDERDSVTPLMMVLEREGYTALYAENSADALAILKDTVPDLILLDVVLGGDSGFDLFQTIKNEPATSDVPILFGSGRSQGSAIVEGIRMGANDYITKPYSPHEICARIELQIKLKEQEKLLKARNRELTMAYKKLENAQSVAIRSEKLAAIGSLSTGIAHEMSTPLSFIISNLKMLGEYIGDIYQVLWAFQDVTSECVNHSTDEELVKLAQSAIELREALALDTVMDELTELARENLEGAESIARIAKDLCEF